MNKAKAYNKAVRIAAKTTRKATESAKEDLVNLLSEKPDVEISIAATRAVSEHKGQFSLICELFKVGEVQLMHDINKALNEEE